jgi:NAD-dependent dihydropyrimidine dehydrogenase PreA subunit
MAVFHFNWNYRQLARDVVTSLFIQEERMAYVIAEPCLGTKDTACVDVCPCDCIHPTRDEPGYSTAPQLYINPADCIDCGACIPVCPVSAIFPIEDLPRKWSNVAEVNAHWYTTKDGSVANP